MIGRALPSWLIQLEPVLPRRFVRNKNDHDVDEVELLEANPNFALVRFPDGRESTVSVSDLEECPKTNKDTREDSDSLPLESQENVTLAKLGSIATAEQPLLLNSDSSANASKSLFSDPDPAEYQTSCRNDSYAFLHPPTNPHLLDVLHEHESVPTDLEILFTITKFYVRLLSYLVC